MRTQQEYRVGQRNEAWARMPDEAGEGEFLAGSAIAAEFRSPFWHITVESGVTERVYTIVIDDENNETVEVWPVEE